MTGRERVAAAFDRSAAEAWPMDLAGSTVTGIADGALARLLEARGLPLERFTVDSVQGISAPPPAVLAALGSDTLRIGCDRLPPLPTREAEVVEARDRFGVTWRRRKAEQYFNQTSTPLGEGKLSEALRGYEFPKPDITAIRASVIAGKREADRLQLFPILDRDCAGLLEMAARLRGTERLYLDLYDDPRGVEALAEALLEYKMAYWDEVLGAWEDGSAGVVGVAEADDYGSEISLLLPPATIRALFIARYRRLFARIKTRHAGARIVFHSCGSIRPLIPDLIEAGVDALNPVQYRAADMDPVALKRDYGAALVFWGGAVDTKRVLPSGSPAEVRAEVFRMAGILGSGGGFVAATVHNIQEEVPTANLLAYLDALGELRKGSRP
jgi:uroporphyrinogen decarboxylase